MTENEQNEDAPRSGSAPARRRRRNAGGTRPHRTVIRHSDEEWARVQAIAERMGISVPAFYERAAFAGSVQAAVDIEEIALGVLGARRLLANAANNLNQIARGVNVGDGVDAAQLSSTLRLFERSIDSLMTELDNLHRFIPGTDGPGEEQ